MSGWPTNGLPAISFFTGAEQIPLDTLAANGVNPQTAQVPLQQLAAAISFMSTPLDKTTVSGTRYYSSWVIGSPVTLTGIEVLIGGTGGTDNWLVELHNSAGVAVANSALAGALVGTAKTWQQFAFTAPYAAAAGTYFLVVQSNGTTAKPSTYNAPMSASSPLITGSVTGTFGTLANFTPATTYTANAGPIALPYV